VVLVARIKEHMIDKMQTLEKELKEIEVKL